jgi:protocatechuate 3,4-dioxygenase beta subunit
MIALSPVTVALFLVSLPWASVAPASAYPQRQGAQVQGHVLNALTNEPIRKAHVSLQRLDAKDPSVVAITDSTGQFLLAGIEPGRYRLGAERTGYIRGAFGARRTDGPGTALVLEQGQQLQDLVFKLMPQSVITGRVLDEEGEPVPDVHVQALGFAYVRGRRQLTSVQDTVSDDLGEYRLHSLAPNRYLVSATSRSKENSQTQNVAGKNGDGAALEETYAPTYFPNTVDPARASEISVAGGEQVRGIDLILLRTPTARIRGRVDNAMTGRQDPNVSVMLFPRDAGGIPITDRNAAAVPDTRGNFEIRGVTPGGYILFAQSGEGSARAPLDVYGSNVNDVNLTITANLEVRGRLSLEGSPVRLGDRRVSLSLQPRDTPLNMIGSTVKSDGTFALSNVAPDNYAVNLRNLPEEYCVKEIHLGTTAIPDGALNLSGSVPGPLDIVLTRSGAELTGAVTDEETHPAPGATITLVPDKSRRSALYLYQTTVSDQYGGFSFRGIAPGDYRVYAWEAIDGGAYLDPDFLKTYESFSTVVTVEEKSRENNLQLKLIPAGTNGQSTKPQ